MRVSFRPVTGQDIDFLYTVYRSTRVDEPGIRDWEEAWREQFLKQQFNLQHTQYMANYPGAEFSIILANNTPAGRLYVHRGREEMRVIDIALLPPFRRQGIGSRILGDLTAEADRAHLPLTLYVEYNNPVQDYYLRLGFRKAGEYGVYHFMRREPAGKEQD